MPRKERVASPSTLVSVVAPSTTEEPKLGRRRRAHSKDVEGVTEERIAPIGDTILETNALAPLVFGTGLLEVLLRDPLHDRSPVPELPDVKLP